MKKAYLILVLACIGCFCASIAAAADANIGIVTVPLANVHETSFSKSQVLTQVLMGDIVHVLEKQDNRYRVLILNQEKREGWLQQEAVLVPKDKGKKYLDPKRTWVIITTPKSDALILDKTGDHKVALYAGTRLPVVQTNERTYKVQFPDRSLALLDIGDTALEKSADPILNETKPEEIAKTAKQFLNVRYLSGGLSAQGMDMRGLIYITYRIHGISNATDISSLKATATRVAKKELQAGDVLIFHGESQGLYLGGGRFLQTGKKGSLKLAGIQERRYANALQFGFRVLGPGLDEKKRLADMTPDELMVSQARAAALPLGKRIAYWGGRFINTPYDTDPLGLYVRTKRIVADEKVDCMYHVFRSVELALTATPEQAVAKALTLRFLTEGKLQDGLVINYDDRYQYGEDMVMSGKWGKNVTAALGETTSIPGSRGKETVDILSKKVLATKAFQQNLKDGDIIYWVKDPKKRVVEEIVAHLSIVSIKGGKPYIIHASGSKNGQGTPDGGKVKEVRFSDYVRSMKFIGAFVTRFE